MAMEISKPRINHLTVQIIKPNISVYPKSSSINHKEPITQIVSLSNLDRQCPDLMYMVFFYKATDQDHLSFQSVFDRLKAGLEDVLSIYNLAAGRLRLSSPNHLDIWCNDGGAVLVEAESGVKISELGDLSLYNEFLEKLVYKPVLSDHGNISDMPLVTAQVTKFECGGYAVGTGTSHSLFDGISAYEFLTAWAACSQGSQTMSKPVHERGPLLLEKNLKLSSINQIPKSIHHLYQLITSHVSLDDHKPQQSLVFNTFHLSVAMIDNLKRNVFNDKKDVDLSCSTFEILAAHLWKVRTKALGLERDRKVCLQFAVDVRKRMVPPLPQGFSGNAYVLASILSTAGELEDSSYTFLINQIKEAKNSVTHDYVHAYIRVLEGAQDTLPALPELTIISDWTRVPFHKISFNGKQAICASPLIPPVAQVAYLIQNPNECRAVDVRIGLLPKINASFSYQFTNIL